MTTLAQLRGQVRLALADETTWPDATLDAYIAAGIRLYAAHFPRRQRAALTLAAGQQVYDLPGGYGLQAVVRVEYPAAAQPARCLAWADEDAAIFRMGGAVYAARGMSEDPASESAASGQIVFAEPVRDGETAIVDYLTGHALPAAGDALLTVPDAHLEAVTAYVQYAAQWQAVVAAEADVSADGGLALGLLKDAAAQAWQHYKEVLDRLAWLGPTFQPPVALPVWEL